MQAECHAEKSPPSKKKEKNTDWDGRNLENVPCECRPGDDNYGIVIAVLYKG